tara:strand:+ start:263 stop:514 length:252 start_codon:yes stop_codon:yes gene_type:complete
MGFINGIFPTKEKTMKIPSKELICKWDYDIKVTKLLRSLLDLSYQYTSYRKYEIQNNISMIDIEKKCDELHEFIFSSMKNIID